MVLHEAILLKEKRACLGQSLLIRTPQSPADGSHNNYPACNLERVRR
jgi:hypothetical protein